GLGNDEFFVASDIPAILSHTRDVVFLGDEEMAIVTRSGVSFTDFFGRPVSKATQRVLWDPIMAEKAGYKHFMLKEIFEQPTAARGQAKRGGARSISICNVVGSMATRETDGTVYTHAGPEIGVASTKAFTSQLVALYLLGLRLGQLRGALSPEASKPHVDALL